MARVTFQLRGVEELLADLTALPDSLRDDAATIIETEAKTAHDAIHAVYAEHVDSGRLVNSLHVERLNTTGAFGVGYRVRSDDPIAWLFDNGSQARHWASGKATGAMWGDTAPTHIFVRSLIAARRNMALKLAALLTRAGLRPSGDFNAAA